MLLPGLDMSIIPRRFNPEGYVLITYELRFERSVRDGTQSLETVLIGGSVECDLPGR